MVHDRINGRLGLFVATQGPAVIAAAPRWKVPTLLMWAGADRCVSPAGSAAFAAAAPSGIVTRRPWDGLYHEIFNEPERLEVLQQLGLWLDATVPERMPA
jgi:alpha-beta hydrolase superfamily lysophospholipase